LTTKTRKPATRPAPQDPQAAALLAGRVRDPERPGEHGITLTGRCGTCGYLLTSPGHELTCS
jgi:hypothetical protein